MKHSESSVWHQPKGRVLIRCSTTRHSLQYTYRTSTSWWTSTSSVVCLCNNIRHRLRSSSSYCGQVPSTRSKKILHERSFTKSATTLWKNLQDDLRSCQSLTFIRQGPLKIAPSCEIIWHFYLYIYFTLGFSLIIVKDIWTLHETSAVWTWIIFNCYKKKIWNQKRTSEGNMTVDMDMFPCFISVTLAPRVLLQLCLVFSWTKGLTLEDFWKKSDHYRS